MRFVKKCPECGEFPESQYIQHLFYNEARVRCPKCLKSTNWHKAIFASDAVRNAKDEWEEIVADDEEDLEEL